MYMSMYIYCLDFKKLFGNYCLWKETAFYFRITRLVNDIEKLLHNKNTVYWNTNQVTSVDRSLNEMIRILEKLVSFIRLLL